MQPSWSKQTERSKLQQGPGVSLSSRAWDWFTTKASALLAISSSSTPVHGGQTSGSTTTRTCGSSWPVAIRSPEFACQTQASGSGPILRISYSVYEFDFKDKWLLQDLYHRLMRLFVSSVKAGLAIPLSL